MFRSNNAMWIVAGAVMFVDQLSKALADHPAGNAAYALGVAGAPAPVLIVVALLVLSAFACFAAWLAARVAIPAWTVAFILAGSLSNTLDRVAYGSVRDFIRVPWGLANVADAAVAAGILGFAIALVLVLPSLRVRVDGP